VGEADDAFVGERDTAGAAAQVPGAPARSRPVTDWAGLDVIGMGQAATDPDRDQASRRRVRVADRAHELSQIGVRRGGRGADGRMAETCTRPCWQTGQRSMSMPVKRSIRACAQEVRTN
jgi:hypothetical protein